MKKLLLFYLLSPLLFASLQNLTLQEALELLKKNNSDIKIAKMDEKIARFNTEIARSYAKGALTLISNALRSNTAENAFGFRLASREATFADFGFKDFLGGVAQALQMANGDFQAFSQIMSDPRLQSMLLGTAPKDLNYPKARNFFQNKVQYQVPLFTGYKLQMYEKISKAMENMKHLESKKVINEMIYQTKKTFYDITLVENYIKNLQILDQNMEKLKEIINAFKEEGYAKDTDVLEVQAKKAEVESYLNQAKLNRTLAYQYLSFLIGEDVESIQHVSELAPLPKEKVDKLVQKALDLKRAKLGKKIRKMNIKLQESGLYPMIGAFGEYGSADNIPFNDFFDKDGYTVGAQLKWTLFEGGKTKKEIEKAKVEYLKTAEQVSLARRGLGLKIQQIKTAVKSKDYDLQAQEEQYRLARKIYEMYEAKYKEGLIGISEVLIKHSEEIQVLMKLLKTKTQRNQKVFELEKLLDKGE